MLIVNSGDVVELKNGNLLRVTDAVDQLAPEVIINPDNIIVGYYVHPELYSDPHLGDPGYIPMMVVTNMDEVVSIIE